jgi:hypothetical protein
MNYPQVNRNSGTGRFQRSMPWQRPASPNYAMFSDEESCDKPRVIDDFHWRAKTVTQAEDLFNKLVKDLTSGAETARPSLYGAGQAYTLRINGSVTVMVRMAYEVGTRWRYQLALLDYPGAVVQLFQTEMTALRPERVYRGYDNEAADTDWPAEETKDHSKVA